MPAVPAPQWLLDLAYKEEVTTPVVTARELPKPEDLDEATWRRLSSYAQRAIDSELKRLDECKAAATASERLSGPGMEPHDLRGLVLAARVRQQPVVRVRHWSGPVRHHAASPRDVEFDDFVVAKTFRSAQERVGEKARPMPQDRREEPDPMFSGPDVRNPTEGGGAPTNPVAGPLVFFGGERAPRPSMRRWRGGHGPRSDRLGAGQRLLVL